jgi:hypothetical protein
MLAPLNSLTGPREPEKPSQKTILLPRRFGSRNSFTLRRAINGCRNDFSSRVIERESLSSFFIHGFNRQKLAIWMRLDTVATSTRFARFAYSGTTSRTADAI